LIIKLLSLNKGTLTQIVKGFLIVKLLLHICFSLLQFNLQHNATKMDNLPGLSTGSTSRVQLELCFDAVEEKLFEPIFD